MKPSWIIRLLGTLLLCAGLCNASHAQRIWLDDGLERCERTKASFYLEGDGMADAHYKAKIFTLDGTLKGEGAFSDPEYLIADGKFTYFYPDGKLESTGNYATGRKDGVWKRYDPRGGELAEKVYDLSHLANLVYTMAQTMPEFPGGEEAMVRYLKENVGRTPRNAMATFVVERNGQVDNVFVTGVDDPTLKEKITNTINTAPRWQAGVQDGQPVRVQMRVALN